MTNIFNKAGSAQHLLHVVMQLDAGLHIQDIHCHIV